MKKNLWSRIMIWSPAMGTSPFDRLFNFSLWRYHIYIATDIFVTVQWIKPRAKCIPDTFYTTKPLTPFQPATKFQSLNLLICNKNCKPSQTGLLMGIKYVSIYKRPWIVVDTQNQQISLKSIVLELCSIILISSTLIIFISAVIFV